MTFPRASAALLTLIVSGPALGLAQTSADDQMKRDIEALKEGQKAIQKDLEEIKKLLQSRPVAADAVPKDPVSIANEPFKGNGSAKVAVIEFSDYQCPFCSRYTQDVLPQIERDYVETGKVKYVFTDLPLEFHKQAFKAAEAAHCAGDQGRFWEMHDVLFQNQKALGAEDLSTHAKTLGLSEASFQECLDSAKFATAIKEDVAEANSMGIRGTPTFLIGIVQPGDGRVKVVKKLVGAKPYAEFKAAIDGLLGAPPSRQGIQDKLTDMVARPEPKLR